MARTQPFQHTHTPVDWDEYFINRSEKSFQSLSEYFDTRIGRARDKEIATVFYGGRLVGPIQFELKHELVKTITQEFTFFWKLGLDNPVQKTLQRFSQIRDSYLARKEMEQEWDDAVWLKPPNKWGVFSRTFWENAYAYQQAQAEGRAVIVDNGKVDRSKKTASITIESDWIKRLVSGKEKDVVKYLIRFFVLERLDRERGILDTIKQGNVETYNQLFPQIPLQNKSKQVFQWATTKADLIRILVALEQSKMILDLNGNPATQTAIMNEFGSMLGADLENYSNDLSKAIRSQPSTNTKIFDKLKKAFIDYYNQTNEKNEAD